MTSTGDGNEDDVGLLLDEAAYRLRCARKYDPLDDPRGFCENAHDAIEFPLNAVIVATGKPYRRTHDRGGRRDDGGCELATGTRIQGSP